MVFPFSLNEMGCASVQKKRAPVNENFIHGFIPGSCQKEFPNFYAGQHTKSLYQNRYTNVQMN
jgi:hypothetical protein